MPYGRKVDRGHGAIRDALRSLGWTVVDTSSFPAFVDLLAVRGGRTEWVEVKSRTGKLTPAQIKLHADLAAAGVVVKVIRSLQDVERL